MSNETIQQLYGMPADKAFEAVRAAVSDLSEYSVKQLQAEALWGSWVRNTPNPAFLEIQVTSEDTGCRISLELRNADTRDRLGLLRREAKRVAGRIQQRMESQLTGEEPPPPARILTDRMVMGGMLAGVFAIGILQAIVMQFAALFS